MFGDGRKGVAARMARLVSVGTPYHVTHRGNRRGEVFLGELDRQLYLADLAVWAHDSGRRCGALA